MPSCATVHQTVDNTQGSLPQNGMGAPERRTQTLQNPRRRKRKKTLNAEE
tara:strand:+ start:26767 stop:26916 length:150 start_codon:yes stop_codon:yes gene_type:complete